MNTSEDHLDVDTNAQMYKNIYRNRYINRYINRYRNKYKKTSEKGLSMQKIIQMSIILAYEVVGKVRESPTKL